MERTILHCDMNNFYASVECMRNPELRSHPVAVCGSVEERHGIVLAKNYKAKDFGVKTGEAVWQAKQKCPGLVVVEPHYEEYMKFSRKARKIYESYTDRIEGMGIDENWLDVTGSLGIFGSPEKMAYEIKERIKFELGLTISVGVSFNKVFAKLGSDMKKPDAVTVIPFDSFREKIWGLPATDMLGVGRATGKVLANYGIRTIGDLARFPEEPLRYKLGINGVKLKQFAMGEDHSAVANQDYVFPAKSIGNGITFLQDLETPEEVWPMMLDLSQEIGHKLYLTKKRATGIAITVRDNELNTRIWQTKLHAPVQSASVISKEAFSLFRRSYQWYRPIRTITISAINLCPQDSPHQIDMFTDFAKISKTEKLDTVVEEIRGRYGSNIIKCATILRLPKMPPAHAEIIMPHSGL